MPNSAAIISRTSGEMIGPGLPPLRPFAFAPGRTGPVALFVDERRVESRNIVGPGIVTQEGDAVARPRSDEGMA
jgi:hypothetical protein